MANIRFYAGPTGQTLYVRIQTGASTFVATALTEGSSGGLGNYTASEATIAALTGMSSASTGSGYPYTVRSGSASASADDPIVGFGDLAWSGSAELSLAAQVSALATVPNVLQRTVSPNRVIQVKDRGDGTYGVSGSGMTVIAGEPKQLWAVEFKGTQLPAGQNLYSMSAPTVLGDDAADSTIGSVAGTSYGVCLTRAAFEFEVDSGANVDADMEVKITVTFTSAGDGLAVYIPVNVKIAEE